MKYHGLIAALLMSSVAFSQGRMTEYLEAAPAVEVKDCSAKWHKETQPAYSVFVHADDKALEKHWVSYLKGLGISAKKSKGFYDSEGIVLPAISADSISLYAVAESVVKGAEITIFVRRGGQFVTPDNAPNITVNARNFLRSYAKSYYTEAYTETIAEQNDEFAKEQKRRDKLLKKKLGLEKSIADGKADLIKLSDRSKETETQVHELENKKTELDNNRETLVKDMDLLNTRSAAQRKEMKTVQDDIDRYNAKGEADSKKYQKAVKSLEKMKKADLEILEDITKKNKEIGKSDERKLDNEKDLNTAEAKRNKLQTDKEKTDNDISSSERDLKETEADMTKADETLKEIEKRIDRLKAASEKIPGL